MTLHYPSLREIKANPAWAAAFGSDLFGRVEINGRNLCDGDDAKAVIQRVRYWSDRSKTAKEILKAVDLAGQKIHVIGMKNCGYTCFDSDCPTKGEGTAYVDVNAQFSVDGKPLHNYICILHELGHAKQFIENPAWFNQVAANRPNVNLKDIQSRALEMAMSRTARLKDEEAESRGINQNLAKSYAVKPQKHTFEPRESSQWIPGKNDEWKRVKQGKALPPKPSPKNPMTPPSQIPNGNQPVAQNGPPTAPPGPGSALGGPPGPPGPPPAPGAGGLGQPVTRSQMRAEGMERLQQSTFVNPHKRWAVIVEQDNMARHEWPICRETNNPVREGYNNIKLE